MKILIITVMCCAYALGQLLSVRSSQSETGKGSPQLSSDTRNARRLRETTATGCLLGQNGKYTLVTSKPSSIFQLKPAPNLEAQVGHKVKITGTIENVTVAPPATTASSAETNEPHTSADISTSGHLSVRRLKMISAVCDVKSDKQQSWIHILRM